MIKRVFFILQCLLLSYPLFFFEELSAQEEGSRLRNPFLTSEEEMRVLGIKPEKEREKTIIPLEKLNLSGIMSGDKKIAIINSEFYTEGDTVGNFTIKEIRPLSVILATDRNEYELELKDVLAIKKQPRDDSPEEINKSDQKEDKTGKEDWTDDIIRKLFGTEDE
jgi:molecular chaperone DnaK (HSP70)